MKKLSLLIALGSFLVAEAAFAAVLQEPLVTDSAGNPQNAQAVVDVDNTGIAVPVGPFINSRKLADGQVKGSAGFIHTISISAITATPTAGLLTVYDSLTETGTVLYSEWIFATDVGHTIILDVPETTGIFVGFDATLANVQATVSYR